jgi:hypothetical protein
MAKQSTSEPTGQNKTKLMDYLTTWSREVELYELYQQTSFWQKRDADNMVLASESATIPV